MRSSREWNRGRSRSGALSPFGRPGLGVDDDNRYFRSQLEARMYQKVSYGADAKAYIRLKLSMQGTLWRMAAQLPIDDGNVAGFLPAIQDANDLKFFEWHLHSRKVIEKGLDKEYVCAERNYIAAILDEQKQGLGIFNGGIVYPGGNIRAVNLEDVRTVYFVREHSAEEVTTEVYYVVQHGITRERLDYFLDNVVERLPRIGLITTIGPDDHFRADQRLSQDMLANLVSGARCIVAGVYGGDANLLWTAPSVLQPR